MGEKSNSLEEKVADKILEDLKEHILDALWNFNPNELFNDKCLLPYLVEEAEYGIMKLNISDDKKRDYLIKIENIIGDYGE